MSHVFCAGGTGEKINGTYAMKKTKTTKNKKQKTKIKDKFHLLIGTLGGEKRKEKVVRARNKNYC